jgi:putative nucleotidyltransferase with HDIG domain
MTPEEIKNRIYSIIQLPALPTVAMEVVQMVDNPRTTASRLGKVISSDQALTAKVLKIANSPFYGFPRKISTIEFAIIILGYDALKEIVISISLISALQKRSDTTFDAQTFWEHAITTGVLARRLARDHGYRVSGEVFVGGVLHDIGISVLHRYFRNEYRRIVEIAREGDLSFREAEESVLGVTHAEVGGWLAERWNLPDQLVEAIMHHHAPSRARRYRDLVAIVHYADVLANRSLGRGLEYDGGIELDHEGLSETGLNDPALFDRYAGDEGILLEQEIEAASRH